jgi:aryl carrier-like protein
MAPARIVLLEALPLTANGKVDRKALPAPEEEDAATALYVGPRNAIEQAMCEVWQEALDRYPVGVQDNFFSLGGDSILSIRVVGMLKGRGIKVEIKDIFQHQTIERLAEHAHNQAELIISKMSSDAAQQRERLVAEGKLIEEGVI